MAKRYFDASILERDSIVLSAASAETLSFDRLVEATADGADTEIILNVDGFDVRRLVVDDNIDTLLAKLPADEVFKATVKSVNGEDRTDVAKLLRIRNIYGLKASGADTIIIYGGGGIAPTEYLVDETITAIKALLDAWAEDFSIVRGGNGTAAAPTFTFTSDTDTGAYRVGANSYGISAGGTLRVTFNETNTTSTVPFLGAAGTAALPTYSFSGDPNTGAYSVGADSYGIATNGVVRVTVDTAAVTSTLPIVSPVGAVATPSYTFAGDLNTGLYWIGADSFGVTTNGTLRATFADAGVTYTIPVVAPVGAVGAASYTFAADLNTGLYWVAADTMGLTAGGTLYAQVSALGFQARAGSEAAPAINFITDPDTGIYSVGADSLGVTVGGTVRVYFNTGDVQSTVIFLGPAGAVGTPTYSFSGDTNTGFYSVGADALGVAIGGVNKGTWNATGLLIVLPTYADNAAAAAGGLAVTGLYKTATGEVRIVV